MKITIITNDYYPMNGGISAHITELTAGLARNHRVHVIHEPNLLKASMALKNSEEDIVIASTFWYGGLLCYLFRKKYILLNYGSDIMRWGRFPRNIIAKQIMKQAIKIVTISQRSLIENVKITGNATEYNFQIVPPPVAIPLFQSGKELARKELGIKQKAKVIVSIGRLIERKGFHLLAEAVKDLPCELYIIGEGPYKDKIPQYNNVHLVGYVNDDRKHQYLEACDLFAMLPIDLKDDIEGFGIVYLEAALHGKPIIGSNQGGVVCAIDKMPVRYITDGTVPTAKYIINHVLGGKMNGRANKLYVYEHYNKHRIADQVMEGILWYL